MRTLTWKRDFDISRLRFETDRGDYVILDAPIYFHMQIMDQLVASLRGYADKVFK